MHLTYFSSKGWEEWDLTVRPVVPEGMPILVDDDLMFEDASGPRSVHVVNRWLRELPSSGCSSPNSWPSYARCLRSWIKFLDSLGTSLIGTRSALKAALSAYAVYRACGPLEERFEASTWDKHVGILGGFYRWAVAEGYATAEPFTYRQAHTYYSDQIREQTINMAVRKRPKPHVTIKYLEPDFEALFLQGLAGLRPDGTEDARYRGRELARNAAVGRLALDTGLRRQEFTYLLAPEIPPLPPHRSELPIPFAVPAGVTKGSKLRTTWTSYEALAELHRYLELARSLATSGSSWMPSARLGPPLVVTEVGPRGGRVNGTRV